MNPELIDELKARTPSLISALKKPYERKTANNRQGNKTGPHNGIKDSGAREQRGMDGGEADAS